MLNEQILAQILAHHHQSELNRVLRNPALRSLREIHLESRRRRRERVKAAFRRSRVARHQPAGSENVAEPQVAI